MNIATKTIGMLIDELITTNIKCFNAQDVITSEKNDTVVANAARQAQKLNARRNKLIRAIDEATGRAEDSHTEKNYK